MYNEIKSLSLPSVFSMSKLPQKHITNQWDNSWDILEEKNKVLNISVVTLQGESQAKYKKLSSHLM